MTLANYSMLGDEKRQKPVWFYDWNGAIASNAERDQQLMRDIAEAIQQYQDSA